MHYALVKQCLDKDSTITANWNSWATAKELTILLSKFSMEVLRLLSNYCPLGAQRLKPIQLSALKKWESLSHLV